MRPPVRVTAERHLAAPAAVVFGCLADYTRHHRPGGFLPPAFFDQQVLEGGIGAGSVVRLKMRVAGRTRTLTTHIAEPEPGRVLVETSPQVQTTFTVEPEADGCRVRFDTRLTTGGLEGVMNALFAARLLRPIYADELDRLERYAQAQVGAAVR